MIRQKVPKSSVHEVRRERKKSLYTREMISLITTLTQQEKIISEIYITHVDISKNSGILYVYCSTFKEPGEEVFLEVLSVLKLYKPSIRKALASQLQSRHTPDIVFLYDKIKEKERRVTDLLEQVAHDLQSNNSVKE